MLAEHEHDGGIEILDKDALKEQRVASHSFGRAMGESPNTRRTGREAAWGVPAASRPAWYGHMQALSAR